MSGMVFDTNMAEFVRVRLGDEHWPSMAKAIESGKPKYFQFAPSNIDPGFARRMVVETTGSGIVRVGLASLGTGQSVEIEEGVEYLVLPEGWVPVRWFSDFTQLDDNLVIEADPDGVPVKLRRSYRAMRLHKRLAKIFTDADVECICLSPEEVKEVLNIVGDSCEMRVIKKLRKSIAQSN